MNDTLYSISFLAGAVAAGLFLYLTVSLLMRRWGRPHLLRGITETFVRLKSPLILLFPSVAVLLVLPMLRFDKDVISLIMHSASLLVMGSLGWFLIKLVKLGKAAILKRYDIDVSDNLLARRIYTQIGMVENIITVVIFILTVSLMLMTFGKVRQIGVSLLASAGIIGIVLGFAAQKILGNFIAGIQIALTQPIRLDDVVIVEGEWGWIEEITLTYVVVRIWDLRRLIVPISYFIEKPFQNWTRTSADILGSVFIYADYTVPIGELREELTRLLEKSKHWDRKVNVLQVTNATERVVEVRALMSAATSPAAWNLRCEVREGLLSHLQKNHPASLPRTRVEMETQKELT